MDAITKFARRHVSGFAVTLPAAFLACGCNGPGATSAAADPAGTYSLVSVDGKPVPTTLSHEGATLRVRSGTFIIGSDGTCSTTTAFVGPAGAEVTRTVNATYVRDGATLTMRWKGAGTTVGTSDGKTFTMVNEGVSWSYSK